MKRWWIIAVLMVLLTGCSREKTLETVTDTYVESQRAQAQQVMLDLPGQAAIPVLESETGGTLYMSDGYTLTVQTRPSGDLTGTIADATGYTPQQLQVVKTKRPEGTGYTCMWICAGEGGNQVGRLSVIDDGNYQYVLSVMAPEEKAGMLQEDQWQQVFRSFRVVDPDTIVSSGS